MSRFSALTVMGTFAAVVRAEFWTLSRKAALPAVPLFAAFLGATYVRRSEFLSGDEASLSGTALQLLAVLAYWSFTGPSVARQAFAWSGAPVAGWLRRDRVLFFLLPVGFLAGAAAFGAAGWAILQAADIDIQDLATLARLSGWALATLGAGVLLFVGALLQLVLRFALLFPIVVAEGRADFARAWALTHHNFWRMLLLIPLLMLPIFLFGEIADRLIFEGPRPIGDPQLYGELLGARALPIAAVATLVTALATVFASALLTLCYEALSSAERDAASAGGADLTGGADGRG